MKRIYNLEIMQPNDELFFQDDERGYGNIVSHIFFEKISEEEGKAFLKQLRMKARVFPRIKSRIIKFLGFYMF